jgi:hypothetical protein
MHGSVQLYIQVLPLSLQENKPFLYRIASSQAQIFQEPRITIYYKELS